jgi:ribosomal protein L37E
MSRTNSDEPYECDLCGKVTHTKVCLACGYPDNKIEEPEHETPTLSE